MADENGQSPHHRADIEVMVADDSVMLRCQENPVSLNTNEAQELASRIFEAAARASGEDPEERDWVRLPMQYLLLEVTALPEDDAEPDPDAEQEVALAHCWIKDQTQRNALHVATGWIAESGWFITEELEQRVVTRADFADSELLRYYEQALIDDEVFVFEHDGDEEPEDAADES